MVQMKQPKTDYGTKGETGEREPKGAKSSDSSGEKKEGMKAGVAMGKADATGVAEHGVGRPSHHMGKHDGRLGEFNDGKSDKVHYEHKRVGHDQDGY